VPAEVAPIPANTPTVLIAVPEDAVDELVSAGLVRELPTLRGPVFDAVVNVGMDSAALVTLMQAPDAIRAFATWLTEWVRGKKDGITIIANLDGRSLRLEVKGTVPIDAVSDFLTAALGTAPTEPEA
jgi:hypothetical protein